MYFSYKQAKLVRAVEPKSKIWGVLGGYPLIVMPYLARARGSVAATSRTTERRHGRHSQAGEAESRGKSNQRSRINEDKDRSKYGLSCSRPRLQVKKQGQRYIGVLPATIDCTSSSLTDTSEI